MKGVNDMMNYRHILVFVVAITIIPLSMIACQKEKTTSTSETSQQSSQVSPAPTAKKPEPTTTPAEKPKAVEPEVKVEKKVTRDNAAAIIELAKGGRIVIEFYPNDAPNTVDNFIKLAQKGFYDGLKFHRVVPGFVVQGGDPLGDGTGGPGYTIKAEFNSRKHLTGTVAMARATDPDSAGSQFYICLEPQPGLDGQYTVFGQVIEGMDLVKGIKVGDVMKKITIVDKSTVKK